MLTNQIHKTHRNNYKLQPTTVKMSLTPFFIIALLGAQISSIKDIVRRIGLYIHIFIYLTIYLCIYVSIYLTISLSVVLSIQLSLSNYQFLVAGLQFIAIKVFFWLLKKIALYPLCGSSVGSLKQRGGGRPLVKNGKV